MMINSINNITLTDSLDDDVLRSLQVYHKLLQAVEPYCITDLAKLDRYIAGLTLYDNFANGGADNCLHAPSRIYKSDTIIQYRLANYIKANHEREEERKKHEHEYVFQPKLPPLPIPDDFLKEMSYASLKSLVDYNQGRGGEINNIADLEDILIRQDMILQYQLHSDMLLLSRIYMYIDKKKGKGKEGERLC